MGIYAQVMAAAIIAIVITLLCTLLPLPAMAFQASIGQGPFVVATLSNQGAASSEHLEGNIESAYGNLAGDRGHRMKGNSKQLQASAMKAIADFKQITKAFSTKQSDAAADHIKRLRFNGK